MSETVILPNSGSSGAVVQDGGGRGHNLAELVTLSGLQTSHNFGLNATHTTTAMVRDRILETHATTLAAIKDSQFNTVQAVKDVQSQIIAENAATRAMVADKFTAMQFAALDIQAKQQATALQDAKDEIIALRTKFSNTTSV